MTHPQDQYSKTATYIVSNFNIYIYIFAQTKMKVQLHSQNVPRFSRTETKRQKALALVFVNSQ